MKNERKKIIYNYHIQIFEVSIPKNQNKTFAFLQTKNVISNFIKNSLEKFNYEGKTKENFRNCNLSCAERRN